jgi:hypothetical protein
MYCTIWLDKIKQVRFSCSNTYFTGMRFSYKKHNRNGRIYSSIYSFLCIIYKLNILHQMQFPFSCDHNCKLNSHEDYVQIHFHASTSTEVKLMQNTMAAPTQWSVTSRNHHSNLMFSHKRVVIFLCNGTLTPSYFQPQKHLWPKASHSERTVLWVAMHCALLASAGFLLDSTLWPWRCTWGTSSKWQAVPPNYTAAGPRK